MTAEAAPRDLVTVYRLGRIVYVPHYRYPEKFVGPGYHEQKRRVSYSDRELCEAGATPELMFLWPRPQPTK
jgi:hypothetical protein